MAHFFVKIFFTSLKTSLLRFFFLIQIKMQWFTSSDLKSHTHEEEKPLILICTITDCYMASPNSPWKGSLVSNEDGDSNKMLSPRPALNTSLFAQSMRIVMGQVQENIKHKYLKSDWATGKSVTKKSINAGFHAHIWRHKLLWGYQKAASLHFFTQHLLLFNSTVVFF